MYSPQKASSITSFSKCAFLCLLYSSEKSLSAPSERLLKCDELLRELEEKDLTEDDLGEFKRKYTTLDGNLSLIPVGARDVDIGDYVGEIFYFIDENRTSGRNFLTVSDLRPVFY